MRQYGTCVAQPVDMGPRVAARLINSATVAVLYVPVMLANDATILFLLVLVILGLAVGQLYMILKKSTTIGGHAMKIVYLRVDSGAEAAGLIFGRMLLTDLVGGATFGLANIALLVTYRDGQHWLDRAMGTVGVLRDTVSRTDALPAGRPFAAAPWQQTPGQPHPAGPTQPGVTPVSMPTAAPGPAVWPPAPQAGPAWPPAPAQPPAQSPVWPPAPEPVTADPAPWSPFTSPGASTTDGNPFARPPSGPAPATSPAPLAPPVAAAPLAPASPTSVAPMPAAPMPAAPIPVTPIPAAPDRESAANPWSLGAPDSPRPPAASVQAPPAPAVPFGPPGQAPLPPRVDERRAEEPIVTLAPPVAATGMLNDETVLDADVGPTPSVVLDDGDVITLETAVVLGRNPIAPADHPDARCVSLVDESKRMSKTHLVLRATDEGVTVVDVGASNGVGFEIGGVVERLTPHQPRLLVADAVVHFGSRTLRASV